MAELAAVIVGIAHNIVSLFNQVPCWCYIKDFNPPPVYTRDPHSLFIAPADGLALSGTRPSACAVVSTELHMYVQVVVIDVYFVIALNPDDVIYVGWRDIRKSRDTLSINWKWFIGVVDVMCFVIVWYWIIMPQIFHALMMACCLVGHSYGVGIAYICYWQTISCLMVICGLRITNSSLRVIWDACLIWVRSVNKFTNAYSNTWNEIRFS